MTDLLTVSIRTLDLDELIEMLQFVRSFADLDRRPCRVDWRLTGLDVHVGARTAPPNEDLIEAAPHVPQITPVVLEPPDLFTDGHLCLEPSGEHDDFAPIACTLPAGHDGLHRNPEYYSEGWATGDMIAGPGGGDIPGEDLPADVTPPADNAPFVASDEGTKGADPQVSDLVHDEALPAHPRPKDPFAGAKPAPAPDPDGDEECVGCESRFRTRRAVSDHIRAAHWDDVIASYAENGVPGIVADWGVADSAARRWAGLITGAAA